MGGADLQSPKGVSHHDNQETRFLAQPDRTMMGTAGLESATSRAFSFLEVPLQSLRPRLRWPPVPPLRATTHHRSGHPGGDNSVLVGVHNCHRAVANAQLGQDACDVGLDCSFAEVKLGCDLGVGLPARQQR